MYTCAQRRCRNGLIDGANEYERPSALKELLRYPAPVALFLTQRGALAILGTCDVDLVTVMAVTSASMERAPRRPVTERTWALRAQSSKACRPAIPRRSLSAWVLSAVFHVE